ncbi:MAG: DNA repair protein RecN [Pseudopedobacter saltans]|uniref:DNA repair protein RecN n=1 Tax=Pseudopedobacter saltans TaxID=151895 RepID=A0A2W5EZ33_9SPHI|nr:MAG: DNA repair protein RecN [Pseudopedobacter saltans]
MINRLFIQNYAIIDEVAIDFSKGLNIITGETGAGKSILIGALSLLLGARAETAALKQKDKKCIVEGVFSVENNQLVKAFLQENELDIEPELVLRREITSAGKSRGFVNDTPVSMQQLRSLASCIVDLHQQFDTLEIGDADFQRVVVDTVANNESLLQQYQTQFYSWQKAKKNYTDLLLRKANMSKELDYLQFQYDELTEVDFKEQELENLEAELKTLTHSEEIKNVLKEVSNFIVDGEQPVVSEIKSLTNRLGKFSDVQADIAILADRLRSVQIELDDIGNEAASLSDNTNLDVNRIDFVNERLSIGYKLLKKHGANTTDELLSIQHNLAKRLGDFQNIQEDESSLLKMMELASKEALELAEKLTQQRKKVTASIEKEIDSLLKQMGMPNAHIKIELHSIKEINAFGQEEVAFLFDANNSGRFEPVQKVASGGELSRLMLSVKSLVARSVQLPTLIFDEIDTGISGEAAKQVGVLMKLLASNIQVISITHQPQIAGMADAHYFVYKQNQKDGMVKTGVRLLDKEERINAIAQMIGGEKPSEAALANAKELVQ